MPYGDRLLLFAVLVVLSSDRFGDLLPALSDLYPANDLPQWADLLIGIFIPRILILIYIYENMGANNIWFAAHLIVMILAYFGGSRETVRRRVRYVDE